MNVHDDDAPVFAGSRCSSCALRRAGSAVVRLIDCKNVDKQEREQDGNASIYRTSFKQTETQWETDDGNRSSSSIVCIHYIVENDDTGWCWTDNWDVQIVIPLDEWGETWWKAIRATLTMEE